ncbi:MAG: hypothetical protein J7465_07560 [Chloroflexus sp.]|nr:hypothetical protein [Chloroflexus sp.]MBO9372508.1 hypothetical protein [Chloroflexus sp.]
MDQATTLIWVSLFGLGLFHGINPAMGWLFAVGLGLQEQRASAVISAFGPIALGHAAAIALAAFVVALLGQTLPSDILLILSGVILLLFSGWRLLVRFRHPRTRFRASARELASWSFLMATAHGAGLMVAPFLAVMTPMASHSHAGHVHHSNPALTDSLGTALLAVGVHTAGMFLAMAVAALVVYWIVGLEVLRRAWVNTDVIWITVLMLTGMIALVWGVWDVMRV